MKVAIVAPYFYPYVGGAEVYTLNMARNLRDLGWKVVIITTGGSTQKRPEPFDGMLIYRLKASIRLSNTPLGIGWRSELRRIFRAERPDVINAHTPVPYLADVAERVSGRIPFVLTYHNDLDKDFIFSKAVARLAHVVLINRTLRRSTYIITTSEYYARQSRYLKNLGQKIRTVPPGVDLSKFNTAVQVGDRLRAAFNGTPVVLFVGSLNKSHRHKGLGLLIKAFASINEEFPETRLVVVGKGDGEAMYKSQAMAAGVASNVQFTGRLSDEELAQYYALATVVAMPSTNRSEGFGMVYIEANASGTPVVGSSVGGVPYAIKDRETGLLVAPRSIDSLRAALRCLLTNSDLAKQLGDAGAERARRDFDWRLLAGTTNSVLRDAVGKELSLC